MDIFDLLFGWGGQAMQLTFPHLDVKLHVLLIGKLKEIFFFKDKSILEC